MSDLQAEIKAHLSQSPISRSILYWESLLREAARELDRAAERERELVEALVELDAFCETGFHSGKEVKYVDSPAMQMALEALAKARGETD